MLNLGPPRGAWKTTRGDAAAWVPASGLLVTRATGHLDAELASKLIAAGNDVVREHGTLLAFHDWQKITTYDGDARKLLTTWGVSIRGKVERVHILTGSKLVRMGVAVASIALGGMMVAYENRTVFEVLLRAGIVAKGAHPFGGALLATPLDHAAHPDRGR